MPRILNRPKYLPKKLILMNQWSDLPDGPDQPVLGALWASVRYMNRNKLQNLKYDVTLISRYSGCVLIRTKIYKNCCQTFYRQIAVWLPERVFAWVSIDPWYHCLIRSAGFTLASGRLTSFPSGRFLMKSIRADTFTQWQGSCYCLSTKCVSNE